MNLGILLFRAHVAGVVDRVEADVVVVEWARGCRSDVPATALSSLAEEGDSVLLRLLPPISYRFARGKGPSQPAHDWPRGWSAAALDCLNLKEDN